MLLIAVAWILADAQADANASLLQYGAIGAVLVLLMVASATGLIIWKPGADWLKSQITQVQAVNTNLLTQVQTAVPALSSSAEANRAMAEAVKEMRTEMGEVRRELSDTKKELGDVKDALRELKQGR